MLWKVWIFRSCGWKQSGFFESIVAWFSSCCCCCCCCCCRCPHPCPLQTKFGPWVDFTPLFVSSLRIGKARHPDCVESYHSKTKGVERFHCTSWGNSLSSLWDSQSNTTPSRQGTKLDAQLAFCSLESKSRSQDGTVVVDRCVVQYTCPWTSNAKNVTACWGIVASASGMLNRNSGKSLNNVRGDWSEATKRKWPVHRFKLTFTARYTQ